MKTKLLSLFAVLPMLFSACNDEDSLNYIYQGNYVTRAGDNGLDIEPGEHKETCTGEDGSSFYVTLKWEGGRPALYPYCYLRLDQIEERIIINPDNGFQSRVYLPDSTSGKYANWGNYNCIEYGFSYVIEEVTSQGDTICRRFRAAKCTTNDIPQAHKYDIKP